MSHLFISEKFTSIQGEGKTMGFPSIFLRLSGCNLLCQSDSWVCDSIEVWRKGTKTEFANVFTDTELQLLRDGYHLIITGGEPMMHEKKILEFLKYFNETHGFIPIIEVETNGTITPSDSMINYVFQWNCSPKLSNSGEAYKKRFKPDTLRKLNMFNTIFKFVIENERDVQEMEFNFLKYINNHKVWLMPAGESQELLNKTRQTVLNICIVKGYKYTDRLHIVAWNKKTGV